MNLRKILICSLFCFSASALFAQYNTMKELYIGPSGGVTISNIVLVRKMVGKQPLLGRSTGFTMRYISESHFGLELDCNYAESGWEEDGERINATDKYSYSRTLKFVEVPFLSHLYTTAGAARFFINIGGTFNYLLSESEDIRTTDLMPQHGKKVETPFQYGLLGGGGLDVKVGRTIVGLEGRYCYNLSNLFKDDVGDDFVNSNLQVVSVNLHVLFQVSGFSKKK
jgi:hypothetical protein